MFVLWDGAFSYARKIDPIDHDCVQYRKYVTAAVLGHTNLGCSITPKVHLMWKHTEDQMRNLPRGLGNKVEDWVERSHQVGNKLRNRLRLMPNPEQRATAKAKIMQLHSNPDVLAQILAVDTKSKKRKHSDNNNSKTKRAATERGARRQITLNEYCYQEVWTLSKLLLEIENKTNTKTDNLNK